MLLESQHAIVSTEHMNNHSSGCSFSEDSLKPLSNCPLFKPSLTIPCTRQKTTGHSPIPSIAEMTKHCVMLFERSLNKQVRHGFDVCAMHVCVQFLYTVHFVQAYGMGAFVMLRSLTNGIIGMEYTYRMYKYTKCKEIYVKVLKFVKFRTLSWGKWFRSHDQLVFWFVLSVCTFIPILQIQH